MKQQILSTKNENAYYWNIYEWLCRYYKQGIAQSMGYADEFTTQSCFYTSNGLSREVMSACQPFGDFCVSLVEQAGEILLGETLGFQNLTNALGNTEESVN